MKKFALSLVAAGMIFFGSSVRAEVPAPAQSNFSYYVASAKDCVTNNRVATLVRNHPKLSFAALVAIVGFYAAYKAYQAAQEEEVTSANFTTSSK